MHDFLRGICANNEYATRSAVLLSAFIDGTLNGSEFEGTLIGFWGKLWDAINCYTDAVSILQDADDSDFFNYASDRGKAYRKYKEYQVAAFWCQQSVLEWLRCVSINVSHGQSYELLLKEHDRKQREMEIERETQQEGETDGEHPKTNE